MAETLETKREGGARTRAMPMKRKKERAATCMVLVTASLTGQENTAGNKCAPDVGVLVISMRCGEDLNTS